MMNELSSNLGDIVLGNNGKAAMSGNGISTHVKNNPDKHGKAYSQNYLFRMVMFHYFTFKASLVTQE